jgi:hypothetical protein
MAVGLSQKGEEVKHRGNRGQTCLTCLPSLSHTDLFLQCPADVRSMTTDETGHCHNSVAGLEDRSSDKPMPRSP